MMRIVEEEIPGHNEMICDVSVSEMQGVVGDRLQIQKRRTAGLVLKLK